MRSQQSSETGEAGGESTTPAAAATPYGPLLVIMLPLVFVIVWAIFSK